MLSYDIFHMLISEVDVKYFRGQLFVASSSHIWCLILVPVNEQLQALMKENQYELALKLAVSVIEVHKIYI